MLLAFQGFVKSPKRAVSGNQIEHFQVITNCSKYFNSAQNLLFEGGRMAEQYSISKTS